eukprot:8033961-Ditylum_brightwellii.AAC.1
MDANEVSYTAQKDDCDASSDIMSDIDSFLHLPQAVTPGVKDMHGRFRYWLVDMDQLTNVVREKICPKQYNT